MTRQLEAAAFVERLRQAIGDEAVLGARDAQSGASTDVDPRTAAHVSGRSIGVPLAWVRPRSTEMTRQVIALAEAHDIVVVPVGAATTFWDGLRVQDALALDTRALREPFAIDEDARIAHVGAGFSIREIDRAARALGLTVASRPDAAGDTPIGSLYAVGSTAGLGMGHGLAIDQISGVTAVLGSGAVVRLGASHMLHGRPDCAHGLPSALDLLSSAEGRGAIVTELGVLLRPAPFVARACARRAIEALPSTEALRALLEIARASLDARTLDTFRVEVGFEGAAARGNIEVMARAFSDLDDASAARAAQVIATKLSAQGLAPLALELEPIDARRGLEPAYEYHWSFPVDEHRARIGGGAFWGLEITVSWGAPLAPAIDCLARVFDALARVGPLHRRFALYPGHHLVSIGVQTLVPREPGTIAETIALLEAAHEEALRFGVPYRRGFAWRRALDSALRDEPGAASDATLEALFTVLDPHARIGSRLETRARVGTVG